MGVNINLNQFSQMRINNTLNLINDWFNVPQNDSWRWQINNNKIEIVEKNNGHATLEKVIAFMNQKFSDQIRSNLVYDFSKDDLHQALKKFKAKVLEKYNDYVNKRPFILRIVDIFLSIFTFRTSAWLEKSMLVNKIDSCLQNGKVFKEIEKKLDKIERQIVTQGPCRIIAHTERPQYLIFGGASFYDRVYSNNDNPREIFQMIKLNLCGQIESDKISSRNYKFKLIQFTKTNSNNLNILYFDNSVTPISFSDISWDKNLFKSYIFWKDKHPDQILDSQGNFISQE